VVRNSIVSHVAPTITIIGISQLVHAGLGIWPVSVRWAASTSDSGIIVTTTLDWNNGLMIRFKKCIRGISHTLSSSECNDGDVSDESHIHWKKRGLAIKSDAKNLRGRGSMIAIEMGWFI
jgi:hypothetical protein